MRLLVQRVRLASVQVNGERIGSIGPGLLALVAFGQEDGPDCANNPVFAGMARKLLDLRLFPAPAASETPEGAADVGNASSFHLSVRDFGGEVLLVPQFTLYADCRKGRRPSFSHAGDPRWAAEAFRRFVRLVDELHLHGVSSGRFGADMDVQLCNWGPVTIWLDSARLFPNNAARQTSGGQGRV